jgi:hypothetical protein
MERVDERASPASRTSKPADAELSQGGDGLLIRCVPRRRVAGDTVLEEESLEATRSRNRQESRGR